MPQLTPFLWFNQEALPAAKFYVATFKGKSRILQVTRHGGAGPQPRGTVMTVRFEIAGQPFTALNGGPHFNFTEAISFVISCRNQAEIDRYWKRLSAGGQEIQCGWLKDRYGLCWQIVPAALPRLLDARHPDRSNRVMQAVMGMVKLDLAELEAAYAGPKPPARRRP